MTVVEFLSQLLSTQAQVLKRLEAFFGQEPLLQLLESAHEALDEEREKHPPKPWNFSKNWFIPAPLQLVKTAPYIELEGAVRDQDLPEFLEFYLWAYPYYRTLIESSLDLKMTMHPNYPVKETLCREAIEQARIWLNRLPVHPTLAAQVQTLGMTPWLRFQNEILRSNLSPSER
jgi:hypothetical protein